MTRNEASKKLILVRGVVSLTLAGLCLAPSLRFLTTLTGPLPQPLGILIGIAACVAIYCLADAAVTELVLFLDGKKSEAAVDPDGNVNQPTA
jgi:hypothetical protein